MVTAWVHCVSAQRTSPKGASASRNRRPASPSLSQRTGAVMVLWASALLLAASSAGLVMLSSTPILGELSALGFAVSLFIVICASEALNEGSRD